MKSNYSLNIFQATYWRFPVSMTAVEMRERARIIQNFASIVARSEDEFEKLVAVDSENDLSGMNDTLFSSRDRDSDDHDEQLSINQKNENNPYLQSRAENAVSDDTEINTEDIRFRLNELLDSDDEVHDEVTAMFRENTEKMKRRRTQAFESDSDEDEGMENISSAPTMQKNSTTNTQSVKKRKAIIESDGE